MKMLLAHG